jgi:hypothetical protein
MRHASKEALERFDRAAQEYALRTPLLRPQRNAEIVQEYEWAKAEIMECLR